MYGRTLEQDIVSDTSGHFKRLMVSLANVSVSGGLGKFVELYTCTLYIIV